MRNKPALKYPMAKISPRKLPPPPPPLYKQSIYSELLVHDHLNQKIANPHYVSDPLPQPLWDHPSTGQL